MVPSVAVVILNWNGKGLLAQFLPSVVKSVYPNLQIIVGDNASTDDSVSYVKATFPGVEIIENDKNYGFAEGYNKVLAQVKADYYVLLNSDVEVSENWILPLVELMESDDQIAIAQPKIKWQADKTKFEYAGAAGGFLDQYGFPFCRGRIFDAVETDEGQYNDVKEIFWASGAALFIKSKYWLSSGGLDGDLFAHMEEIDLCWRMKNMGYKVMYCPDAEIYHVGGGSLNATNPYKTYLNFRNNLVIMQKNLTSADAFRMIFIRFFLDFAALLHFLVRGEIKFAQAVSKAHLHFFRDFKQTRKKRAAHQLAYNKHTGVYHSSIVYQYFIKKVKKFSHL
ncbi:glycosyltransferase family 2 protein [Pedobacter sp.]|uniref:glycosyltransferase family 2 protein n=1 Tax=Pedobacter sp. TaxID=1411316 RepID=UPI003D7F1B8E